MARRWDDSVGIVTPEAVPLQFAEANVGSRAVGFFIDAIVIGLLLAVINTAIGFLFTGTPAGLPEWLAITTLVLVNFAIVFGYPIAFETMLRGRSPGKAAMGLRVVTVEGAPERFRHAAIRAALGLVDFLLTMGVAAVLSTFLSKRHQRLGDMVAGTVVLRERTAGGPSRVARFMVPDGAESYAATIEVSGLSPHDYAAVREFLLRAPTLRPQARTDIARQLAVTVAGKLGHTPPSNVSPELFLVCLAARYQQREQALSVAPAAVQDSSEAQAENSRPSTPPAGDFAPPS